MTVITTYKDAPTKTLDIGGARFAYRQLGSDSGTPVIFLNHLAGSWTTGTPGSSTASPRGTG
jgi:pimeloyl-ACP methyl ester carboxylesterase